MGTGLAPLAAPTARTARGDPRFEHLARRMNLPQIGHDRTRRIAYSHHQEAPGTGVVEIAAP